MPQIAIFDVQGARTVLELDPGRRYSIGRAESNDIGLADPRLSRRHAELFFRDGSWQIADCGSSNGTWVDGQRLDAPLILGHGKRIVLGDCSLLFESVEERSEKVVFSDRPLAGAGTVMLSAEQAMAAVKTARIAAGDEAELERIRRRYGAVEKANLELLAHEPLDVLLEKILDLVFEAVKPDRAALLCTDDDGKLVCQAFRGKGEQEMSISRTIARTVMDERVSVLTADAQSDERFAGGASIAVQGIRGVMAAPLWNNREVIGLVYTDSRLAATRFSEDDLRLLTMLANVAAIQIRNAHLFEEQLEKQRFEREANAAAKVQKRLLPAESPELEGYEFVGYNTPCYEAGGDYFDCVSVGPQRETIVLADVAGKGMGAALLMAGVHATFHARVGEDVAPHDLVRQLNAGVARSAPLDRFVTLFLIDLDRAGHRLTYVNAGHAPSPILVRASGEMTDLVAGGPPLGIVPGFEYPAVELELQPGDFVFVCSDGLTDTENPEGEMFGDERLRDLLAGLAGRSVAEVRRAVDEQLQAFSRGAAQSDDLTLLAVRRKS